MTRLHRVAVRVSTVPAAVPAVCCVGGSSGGTGCVLCWWFQASPQFQRRYRLCAVLVVPGVSTVPAAVPAATSPGLGVSWVPQIQRRYRLTHSVSTSSTTVDGSVPAGLGSSPVAAAQQSICF